MARFNTIDALDDYIERIIKSRVEHFYSDWKHHDRPKYMGFKGSDAPEDKDLILITRPCGTELFTKADAFKSGTPSNTVLTYYREQERADTDIYNIDLAGFSIKRMAL